MELPQLIVRFVETQNNQDSRAYMECFSEAAIVHDEGKTHTGKEEICQWIEEANEKYQSSMDPLKYEESGSKGTLTAEVSGTFPGSPMYANKMLNGGIIATSLIVFVLSLICLRTQAFISDRQYMKGMIPHHSSAIMTSRHVSIKDPEVRKLADSIIKSQREEINQMKAILERTEK